MKLHKTEKAHAELKPGSRNLGQRERSLLLMANGTKVSTDFLPLYGGDGEQIILRLLRDGYLETRSSTHQRAGESIAVPSIDSHAVSAEAQSSSRRDHADPGKIQVIPVSVDQFEGKRSLATTRMFLFDICERMFARRDPVMANHFREALRQARDRDSMLETARTMIDEIEKVAGHERADSISERIAMLLPSELVT